MSRPAAVLRSRPDPDDSGFTLIEVLVSIAIITVMMASLTLYYVRTAMVTRDQSDLQAAIQVAVAGMEKVSQLPGTALLRGRIEPAVRSQWWAPGVDAYLSPTKTELAWQDSDLAGGAPAESLPTSPEPVSVGGTESMFKRSWYVGRCWQPPGAGECVVVPTDQQSGSIPMYRVVVAVTWSSNRCPQSMCSYVSAALVGISLDDPFFLD